MQDAFVVNREKLEVKQSRIFDASRERLWKAMTDPRAIPQWWGPRYLTTIVDKMDVRVNGEWRFIQHDESGNEYAFHGTYLEILEPERLVYTFIFEPTPDHVVVATCTFEKLADNRTKLTEVSRYETVEDLDGMIKEGMESGARESWERLAEMVEVLKEGESDG